MSNHDRERAELAEALKDSDGKTYLAQADAILAAGWRPPLQPVERDLADDTEKVYTERDGQDHMAYARRHAVSADPDTVEQVAHAITKAASDKVVMDEEELKLARAAINAIGGGDA